MDMFGIFPIFVLFQEMWIVGLRSFTLFEYYCFAVPGLLIIECCSAEVSVNIGCVNLACIMETWVREGWDGHPEPIPPPCSPSSSNLVLMYVCGGILLIGGYYLLGHLLSSGSASRSWFFLSKLCVAWGLHICVTIYMPCRTLCKPTSPAVPSPRDMWLTLTRVRRFFWLWPQPSGMGSSLISGPSGTCYRVWPFRFCPHANRSFKLSSLSRYVSLSYTAVCSKIQIANMGEFTDKDKNKSSCTDWILLL